MRVLIVPDKFKGTLTATTAAAAIARGWRRVRPRDRLILLPMSDGGDGFGAVLSGLVGARARVVATVDAARRPLRARWWWQSRDRRAIVEAAEVVGLARLPRGRFHPFNLDTFGLGAVFAAAARAGAREVMIGIGGSATNDGGFGLARALGWRFLDHTGGEIEKWTGLRALAQMEPPTAGAGRSPARVTVAVDVQNPLLGPRGCSRIYGPQKGLRPEDMPVAEACLQRLAELGRRDLGRRHARTPGAGAAGGLGFGLLTFLNASPRPGFELFADAADLRTRLAKAELVITAEGAIDRSTLMGKGTGELVRLCAASGVPCVGLAGQLPDGTPDRNPFCWLGSLDRLTSVDEARRRPAFWLARLAQRCAATLPPIETRAPR